jgi:hypothetical protein
MAGRDGRVEAVHAAVDQALAPLAERQRARLACRRGCSGCCVDGITVFEIEAERLRREHAELLATATPHAPGACAFLGSEGECRAYAARPYVCRTQGFPLRWIAEIEGSDELGEYRDVCALNDRPELPPLEALDKDDCWTLGPIEEVLRRLQEARDGGVGGRVALRDLFPRR